MIWYSKHSVTPPTITPMSSLTRIRRWTAMRRWILIGLTPLGLVAQAACSEPASPSNTPYAAAPATVETPMSPSPSTTDDSQTASKIIATRDRTIAGGKHVCDIDFAYAGREPEDVFWEEPCKAVTAKMIGSADLKASGRWSRLDSFQQKFVDQMPGGRVLYIEGSLSASVYPIDETGNSIEVPVAD